jgi:hypothetical protein
MRARGGNLTRENVPVGRLGGFPVLARLEGWTSLQDLRRHVQVDLHFGDLPVDTVHIGHEFDLPKTSAAGLVQRLEHRLAGIESVIGDLQSRIAVTTRELGHAHASIGETFPHAAELTAARDRLAAVDAELDTLAHQAQQASRPEEPPAPEPRHRSRPYRVADEVRAILAEAETAGDRLVLPRLLDRGMYERVDAALQAAGGRWDRRRRAHIFDGSAAEAIQQLTAA